MYDPFKSLLLGEYLDCGQNLVPFQQDAAEFHLDKSWYDTAHKVTMDCMANITNSALYVSRFDEFNK